MLIKKMAVLTLAMGLCLSPACQQFSIPANIYLGIEEVMRNAPPITTYDGEWLCEEFSYVIRIVNRTGTLTMENGGVAKVGDVVMLLPYVDGYSFNGRQMFRDGRVHDVIGALSDPTTMVVVGGGLTWGLTKIRDNPPTDANEPNA